MSESSLVQNSGNTYHVLGNFLDAFNNANLLLWCLFGLVRHLVGTFKPTIITNHSLLTLLGHWEVLAPEVKLKRGEERGGI